MTNPRLRVVAATALLILTVIAVLGAIAGVSLFLGFMEGLSGPWVTAIEWALGLGLLGFLCFGLVVAWNGLYAQLAPKIDTDDWIPARPRTKRLEHIPPDGYWAEDDVYVTGTGQRIHRTHDPRNCEGRGCSIHHPSDHAMRSFRTHWRDDRGLMERICEHGVGHPDPDHMAFLREMVEAGKISQENASAEGVHGCDGCCVPGGFERLNDQSKPLDERQAELNDQIDAVAQVEVEGSGVDLPPK